MFVGVSVGDDINCGDGDAAEVVVKSINEDDDGAIVEEVVVGIVLVSRVFNRLDTIYSL
jgi:hypothetical protein